VLPARGSEGSCLQAQEAGKKGNSQGGKAGGKEGKSKPAQDPAANAAAAAVAVPDHTVFNPPPADSAPSKCLTHHDCCILVARARRSRPDLGQAARSWAQLRRYASGPGRGWRGVDDSHTNNDRTEGSSKAYSCRYYCRFCETSVCRAMRAGLAAPHPDMVCMRACCVLLCTETVNEDPVPETQEAPVKEVADASKGADGAKRESREDAEKVAKDLEEESYKQMQNFDDYSKTLSKGKLTLASLLGKASSSDTVATGADEEAAEEKYCEGEGPGEDGEYYGGEEGEQYEEEECAPLPEVASPPHALPTSARSHTLKRLLICLLLRQLLTILHPAAGIAGADGPAAGRNARAAAAQGACHGETQRLVGGWWDSGR